MDFRSDFLHQCRRIGFADTRWLDLHCHLWGWNGIAYPIWHGFSIGSPGARYSRTCQTRLAGQALYLAPSLLVYLQHNHKMGIPCISITIRVGYRRLLPFGDRHIWLLVVQTKRHGCTDYSASTLWSRQYTRGPARCYAFHWMDAPSRTSQGRTHPNYSLGCHEDTFSVRQCRRRWATERKTYRDTIMDYPYSGHTVRSYQLVILWYPYCCVSFFRRERYKIHLDRLANCYHYSWNYTFPTRAEWISWIVFCFVAVGAVCIFSTVNIAYLALLHLKLAKRLPSFMEFLIEDTHWQRIFDTHMYIKQAGVGLYIIARFGIMALVCSSLRALPEDSYTTIGWVTSIPHF